MFHPDFRFDFPECFLFGVVSLVNGSVPHPKVANGCRATHTTLVSKIDRPSAHSGFRQDPDCLCPDVLNVLLLTTEMDVVFERRGNGLFARQPLPAGSVIGDELPIVVSQEPESRLFSANCASCGRFLGDAASQVEHLLKASELGDDLEDQRLIGACRNLFGRGNNEPIGCQRGCGEIYCSVECHEADYTSSHNFLCVGQLHPNHAIVRFKEFCLSECNTFVLVAKLLCWLVNRAHATSTSIEDVVSAFLSEFQEAATKRWECLDGNMTERSDLVEQALVLLREGLCEQAAQFHLLFDTSELFSRLLGLLERTLIDVRIGSPVPEAIVGVWDDPPELACSSSSAALDPRTLCFQLLEAGSRIPRKWLANGDAESDASSESDDETEVEGLLNGFSSALLTKSPISSGIDKSSLAKLWPAYHGSGFYRTVALMNHSCSPNLQVVFSDTARITFATLSDIRGDEELTISYIPGIEEMGFMERQQRLTEFGFTCECDKCQRHL